MLTIEINGYDIYQLGHLFLLSDQQNRQHRLIFHSRVDALTYAQNCNHSFDFEADLIVHAPMDQ